MTSRAILRRRVGAYAVTAAVVAGAWIVWESRPRGAALRLSSASPVERREGVFLWTRADADVLARGRVTHPGLVAAVHVATIVRDGAGTYAFRRALSPLVAPGATAVALVVRIDDSMHPAFQLESADQMESHLAAPLGRILRESAATGARFDELILDYDAPERSLGVWAELVGRLARGVLSDIPVWVTSLPAHVDVENYGDLFARAAVGHILQLFDTGLACTTETGARLARDLTRHHLAFRVAVGAYERARAEPLTSACWQTVAGGWASLPGYSGFWIFPAEHELASSIERLSARRALGPEGVP